MTPFRALRPTLIWSILAFTPTGVGAQTAATSPGSAGPLWTISGQLIDSVSRKPVSLAEVTVRGAGRSANTDFHGQFVIRLVPPGLHSLDIRRVGYEPLTVDSLPVEGDVRLQLPLILTPSAFQLREISVAPGAFSIMESSPAARQTLSRDEIETAPFGEDLFRAVSRLPGLTTGDYSAHFSVRGGRHDETLILLDGLELYEPYHMKDFNEGALSIVDVGAIEGVDLLTGGFPARYGDKRSGVFNITSRTPAAEGTRAALGLSFTHARAAAEGTLGGGKGSWLVSARRGYIDLVLGLIKKNELPSPRYEDVFASFRYSLHPRHQLSLNLLHAGDRYSFNANATTGFADSIRTRELADNRYGNSYLWLTLRSLVANRLAVTSLASVGRVTAGRDGTERFRDRPGAHYTVNGHRDFSVVGFKQDWTYEHSNAMLLDFGYDLRALHADYALTASVGQDPDDTTPDTTGYYPQVTSTRFQRPGTTIAGYLTNRLQLAAPLTLELGLRYDHASYTRDRYLSPRTNALIRLSERASMRVGWGYYRQRQGIADLAALDALNRYFPSELSKQATVGMEYVFPKGGTLRLEGYYKTGSHLRPVYRNWKGGIDVFPESNEDRILVFPERTTSTGIEILHDRTLGTKWSLQAGYSLSYVNERVRRIDNVNDPTPIVFDRTHPGPQDQRHALNLDLTFRPDNMWSINAAVAFHTGWPSTTESVRTVIDSTGQPQSTVKPDKLYGHRLPSYQRVDLRITRRKVTRQGEFRLFAEVINLTNHRNVLGYDYFRNNTPNGGIQLQRGLESWFSILPSIGVSWSRQF